MQRYGRYAKVAGLAAEAAGYDVAGEALSDVGEIAEGSSQPGYTRRVGANFAGWMTARKLSAPKEPPKGERKGYGMSGGKAAAVGGAVSAALQGEGAAGIARGSANWYVLYTAFGALFTIAGSIPALLYLDFHYLMSTFGSKLFNPLTQWQRTVLGFANALAAVFVLLAVAQWTILVVVTTCMINHPLRAWWEEGIAFCFTQQ